LEEAVQKPEVDQVRQLKQLQEENGRLKKLAGELTLDQCRTYCEKAGKALTAPPRGGLRVQAGTG